MAMEFLWEFLTYKIFDKFQRRRCNQNSLKIRWQWNSYGNSSRILIRILVENAAAADRGIPLEF